jgi:hypothetical protein
VVLALVASWALMPSVAAQGEASPASPVPISSSGPQLPASRDPRSDLWIQVGPLLARIHGETGDVLERIDVATPECQPDIGWGAEATENGVWLVEVDRDPGGHPCAVFVSANGGEPVGYTLELPATEPAARLESWAADPTGLWLVTIPDMDDGVAHSDRGTLYRFDAATRTLEVTATRIAGVAVSWGQVVVVYARGRGDQVRYRAGFLMDDGKVVRADDASLQMVDYVRWMAASDDFVLLATTRGRYLSLHAASAGTTRLRIPAWSIPASLAPGGEGVWIARSLGTGARALDLVPWNGDDLRSVEDPCDGSDAARGCQPIWVGATADAGWLWAGAVAADAGLDLEVGGLYRIDGRSLSITTTVSVAGLVSGSEGAVSSPRPSMAPDASIAGRS